MIHLFLRLTISIALASFGLHAATSVAATEFHFQFNQESGPHSVGLKVVEQYDQSRSFQTESGSPGDVNAKSGPRPLQTLLWYPAEQSSRKTMTFGDYGALIKTETSFGKPIEKGKPQAFVAAFMLGTTETHAWAVRDAKVQAGRFPVVVYVPSVNAPATENIELCEYVASQGFVVLASPSMGAI